MVQSVSPPQSLARSPLSNLCAQNSTLIMMSPPLLADGQWPHIKNVSQPSYQIPTRSLLMRNEQERFGKCPHCMKNPSIQPLHVLKALFHTIMHPCHKVKGKTCLKLQCWKVGVPVSPMGWINWNSIELTWLRKKELSSRFF